MFILINLQLYFREKMIFVNAYFDFLAKYYELE